MGKFKPGCTHLVTHGMAGSKAYQAWSSMRSRCGNPNNPAYHNYGGRGIAVCERWLKFENFFADMGERPAGMSLDRVDNDGPYSPENCRWATRQEQARNRRDLHMVTANGETRPLYEWAELTGIKLQTLWNRVKLGWAPERVVSEPIRLSKRWHAYAAEHGVEFSE